jgi:ornithine--oxo-acid transaminase
MMTHQDFSRLEDSYGANNYKPFDVVISRGKGVWVWDIVGNRYLDCVSAYSAVNHGHCHPKIHKAFIEQSGKLSLISRAFRTDQTGPFYKEVCEATGSRRVLMMNSGAEAVETALKAVRKWGYRHKHIPENRAEIIVCADNFHGRTIAVVGFSTVEKYKQGFGPFPAGFVVIPFGDAEALRRVITPNTAGFLVEPIQGEGGINVPPDGYLAEVRRICTENDVCLVFDEIQTGLGRTGRLLAEEHEHVKADLSIIGKSLGGGFLPVSAVLARGEVLDVFSPGEHGSTFGANPLACAVGRSALRVIAEEGLVENSRKMGEYIKKQIEGLESPYVKGVRGRGLMLGIELNDSSPSAEVLSKKLIDSGLLCIPAGARIVRFTPPIILDEEQAGWALERFTKVLTLKR